MDNMADQLIPLVNLEIVVSVALGVLLAGVITRLFFWGLNITSNLFSLIFRPALNTFTNNGHINGAECKPTSIPSKG